MCWNTRFSTKRRCEAAGSCETEKRECKKVHLVLLAVLGCIARWLTGVCWKSLLRGRKAHCHTTIHATTKLCTEIPIYMKNKSIYWKLLAFYTESACKEYFKVKMPLEGEPRQSASAWRSGEEERHSNRKRLPAESAVEPRPLLMYLRRWRAAQTDVWGWGFRLT